MPFEETVTIINNSGKIISTGRHLLNLFKEAKANYDDRKAAIREIRRAESASTSPGIRRAATYAAPSSRVPDAYSEASSGSEEADTVPPLQHAISFYAQDEFDPTPKASARLYIDDDNRSFISKRSPRSHRSSRSSRPSPRTAVSSSSSRRGGASLVASSSTASALTSSNLRALTEISSVAPSRASTTDDMSRAPGGYRSPYAETAPRDMQISRAVLSRAPESQVSAATIKQRRCSLDLVIRPSMPVATGDDDHDHDNDNDNDDDDDDDALAYGSLPPDLQGRHDLVEWEEQTPEVDAEALAKIIQDEKEAKSLIRTVEKLLDEAHCVHHTASSIIEHLQGNPEAAAAVALTLAELSSILGKLSPGILGLIKGGSPAVFALLASPQFLIGATAAVGVTVVMFGGWKIIKKLQGQSVAPVKQAMAVAAPSVAPAAPTRAMTMPQISSTPNSLVGAPEQALVLDDVSEVSSIEKWRRGVPVLSDDDAEMELISPHARKHRHRSSSGSGSKFLDDIDPDDSISNVGFNQRSHRSSVGTSVPKHSSSSSSSSSNSRSSGSKLRPKERNGASSISRSKSVSVVSSSRSSKVSSSSSRASAIKGKSTSTSTSTSMSSKPSSSSVVSTSLSASKHKDKEHDKERKKKDEKLDEARSRVAEKAHRSLGSGSGSGKSIVSVSSSSSKKDKKEKEEEKKEDRKKPNLLKSMFQRKKANEYAQSAVVA